MLYYIWLIYYILYSDNTDYRNSCNNLSAHFQLFLFLCYHYLKGEMMCRKENLSKTKEKTRKSFLQLLIKVKQLITIPHFSEVVSGFKKFGKFLCDVPRTDIVLFSCTIVLFAIVIMLFDIMVGFYLFF